jgi:hypothetical protein
MRRVIVIAAAGFSLAGCSSFSSMGDYFKSTPPTVQVQLDSQPKGANARTSIGPSCKTPCSVTLPITPETTGFSVSYELDKFLPVTVQALITRNPGDFSTPASINVDPNPVVGELQPLGPPPKAKKRVMRPKKPKPAADAAAAAPAAANSAFPAPAQAAPAAAPPPPPPPTH